MVKEKNQIKYVMWAVKILVISLKLTFYNAFWKNALLEYELKNMDSVNVICELNTGEGGITKC